MRRWIMAGLGMAAANLPASADPAACDAIQNGFHAVASVPGYRQVVERGGGSDRLDSVVIGETIYMRVNDRWTRMRLKAGGRKGMLQDVANIAAISDCRELRSEPLANGGRAKVYEYKTSPARAMPGADGRPRRHEVWIGIDDGLIHRHVGEQATLTLAYDRVMPPIP